MLENTGQAWACVTHRSPKNDSTFTKSDKREITSGRQRETIRISFMFWWIPVLCSLVNTWAEKAFYLSCVWLQTAGSHDQCHLLQSAVLQDTRWEGLFTDTLSPGLSRIPSISHSHNLPIVALCDPLHGFRYVINDQRNYHDTWGSGWERSVSWRLRGASPGRARQPQL